MSTRSGPRPVPRKKLARRVARLERRVVEVARTEARRARRLERTQARHAGLEAKLQAARNALASVTSTAAPGPATTDPVAPPAPTSHPVEPPPPLAEVPSAEE